MRRSGLRAVVYREMLLLTRNRTNLLLAILPTAIYLLLFATSLTNLVGTVTYRGAQVGYAEFTIPAIMLSSMLAATTTTGTSLFQEEMGGMSLEVWSYPVSRGGYIAGKIVATTALVVVQSLAALIVGLLLFDLGWPGGHWLALVVGTVVVSLTFNGLYLLFAALVRDFQRFMVLINVLGPFLLFSSPSFYPVERMPLVLRWLSTVNPVTYGISCLRGGALAGWDAMWPSGLGMLAGAIVLFTVIAAVLNRRIREL
ncbi:ABC transporter permease [Micromonospora wenchangensis]|uniref:ABC transporter permease n=1 Tax=Micromonospora wenchangensis TaxID=1185415 RepID=UPI001B80957E|nr:ABC transporter permease [Micromonospora wenchangensis]